ncbi:MAG: type II toxin-antitoxin system VapC family toxin [Terriglobia bacterium]
MSRFVLLDTSVLSLVSNPRPSPLILACRQWTETLIQRGNKVFIPEIADYELRRELLRAKKTKGITKLDSLCPQFKYLPLTTTAMRQAAVFWAQARQQGQPTAADNTIDCDMILVAQAATLGAANFIIATTNIRHLTRFVPADLWQNIS